MRGLAQTRIQHVMVDGDLPGAILDHVVQVSRVVSMILMQYGTGLPPAICCPLFLITMALWHAHARSVCCAAAPRRFTRCGTLFHLCLRVTAHFRLEADLLLSFASASIIAAVAETTTCHRIWTSIAGWTVSTNTSIKWTSILVRARQGSLRGRPILRVLFARRVAFRQTNHSGQNAVIARWYRGYRCRWEAVVRNKVCVVGMVCLRVQSLTPDRSWLTQSSPPWVRVESRQIA